MIKESRFRAGDKLALKVYEKKIIVEIEMPREEFYKENLWDKGLIEQWSSTMIL